MERIASWISTLLAASSLTLAGCSGPEATSAADDNGSVSPAANAVAAADAAGERWGLQSSGEGVALAWLSAQGSTAIRLYCPAGRRELLVNVPAFSPIGSEERLSFGSGGEVTALVADTRGDRKRGGVSGTGQVPANLAALVGGPVSASYGSQAVGPLPAPPPALVRDFVAACGEEAAAVSPPAATPAGAVSPCLVQGRERLAVAPLRAVGTEPFWGARIEGRCVTYSHPDDQAGTRIWTRYAAAPGGATWTGALGGRLFVLTTRAAPGCSDGMSDEVYPIAVELEVNGERRTGCARPA